MNQFLRRSLGAICACALLYGSAACGGSPDHEGVTHVTLWTWQSTIKDFTSAFEKEHPGIRIDVVNVGSNDDEYMQLSNAIAANSGVPDLVYMDYDAVQQFAASDELRDVKSLGFDAIADDFTDSSLSAVSWNGARYGLPISSGPMVMYYNTEVFAKAGIDGPPKTWDEYAHDARRIAALGHGTHIANDSGDAGMLVSLLWQAGAKPFSVQGTRLGIDFSGSGVARFTSMWQPLIDADLVDTTTKTWSQDWYQGLARNKIGTVLSGAWMSTTLKKNIPETAGRWRVAPMPQYRQGEHVNSENGGGALVLPSSSDGAQTQAAYAFAEWYAHEGGVRVNLDQGGLPPLKSVLGEADYLAETDDFFGGQQTHQVIAEASKQVDASWQYLPFMAYANQISVNSVGQAYLGKTTLSEALHRWGTELSEYGRQQGFQVE